MNQENIIIGLLLLLALPITAQVDSFEQYKQQQGNKFYQYSADKQAEWDAYRKRVNEEYANFMRQAWESFPAHEAEKPKDEKTLPPVVYEDSTPAPNPEPKPKEEEKPSNNERGNSQLPSLFSSSFTGV